MTSETPQPVGSPELPPVEPEPATMLDAATAGPAAPSRRTRTIVNGVLVAALAVLVGGVGFGIGRATAPESTVGGDRNGLFDDGFRPGDRNGGLGQFPGGPGGNGRGGAVGPDFGRLSMQGTVKAVGRDSMTLQLADGNTIEIAIDSDTNYHRGADGSASDLSVGRTVIVRLRARPGAGWTTPIASDITIVP